MRQRVLRYPRGAGGGGSGSPGGPVAAGRATAGIEWPQLEVGVWRSGGSSEWKSCLPLPRWW